MQTQSSAKPGSSSSGLWRALFLDLAVHVEGAIEKICGSKSASQPAQMGEMAQLEAARALVAAGDVRPVKEAITCLVNKDSSAWRVKLLEETLSATPGIMASADVRILSEVSDPLQRVSSDSVADLKSPGMEWDVYRNLDCSRLRQLAKLELKRRDGCVSPRESALAKAAAHS